MNLIGNYKKTVRNIELEFEGKCISDYAMIANTFNNYFVDVISVLTKSICLDIPCIALMMLSCPSLLLNRCQIETLIE